MIFLSFLLFSDNFIHVFNVFLLLSLLPPLTFLSPMSVAPLSTGHLPTFMSFILFSDFPTPSPSLTLVLPWVWNYSIESGGLTSGYILKILIPPTTHNLSKSISSTVGGREPQILPHPWLLLTGLILFQATSVAVGSRSQWLCLLSTMPALVCTLTSSVWQLPFLPPLGQLMLFSVFGR